MSSIRAWTPPRVRILFLLFLLIQIANVFDLWATMQLMNRGAEEANPLVRWIMSHGPHVSYIWKIAVVSAFTLILMLAARKVRFAWHALVAISYGFVFLSGFHTALLTIPSP